jgi:hypothetical protein
MEPLPLDVIGPGIVVALGVGGAVAAMLLVVVVVVEAVILRLMRWGTLWRSLRASFVMNLVSGVAGVFIVGAAVLGGVPAWVLVTYVLTLVLEGAVLMLFKRGHVRQNVLAVLVANTVTYVPLGVLYAINAAGGIL